MAPTETNHGSGDMGGQPNPPEQHQPAIQETEQYPDSISLSQTPETALRAFGLNDNDHPGAEVDNTAADLANGAPGPPSPHIQFPYSPPRSEGCLTPPTSPATEPPGEDRITTWFHDQDQDGPPIGLGLPSYPPGTPGAPGTSRDGQGGAAGAKKNGRQPPSGKE